MSSNRYMVIGEHTYGIFNTIKEHFTCTHGAWDAKCNIIDQDTCFIFGKEVNYKWLDNLPDEYNRT